MTTALGRDPVVRGGAAFVLAALALYLLRFLIPVAVFDFVDTYIMEPLFLAVIVVFLRLRGRASTRPEETRFWNYACAAFSCWLAASLFMVLFPEVQETTAAGLSVDFSYLLMYLLILVSLESGAHLKPEWRRWGMTPRFESVGMILFLLGLLGYFVLIPSTYNVEVYGTWIPSFYMYIALDLFVLFRFATAMRWARSEQWRRILGLFCAVAGVWVVSDLLEAMLFADILGYETYTTLSVVGFLAGLGVLAATRVRESEVAEGDARAPQPAARSAPERLRGTLVIYAYLFPMIHFTFYGANMLDAASRPARELLVTFALIVMGCLTAAQHLWLDRRNRELQSDLWRATAELHRSQRLEAIGRLAGGVAHDFNNLLTVIRGASESSVAHAQDPGRVRRYLATICKASDQANVLTRKLLALGSRQFLAPEVISLNELVEAADDVITGALGEGIEYRKQLESSEDLVKIDPAQLNQVLLNFAVNARDAMPEGGTFTIETYTTEDFDGQGHPGIALVARDTGRGMDPTTLECIFDPFYSTKEGSRSSGLGLSTVYGIVKQSGGEIQAESRSGQGSTFTVEFPLTEAPESVADPSHILQTRIEEPTVLLVDDDRDVLELVAELLAADGYQVLTANDGVGALEVCDTHEGPIHLLLTDVIMPRMNGAELADRVRLGRPETPILYMSGYVDDPESRIRIATEAGALIKKPFTAEHILGEVGRLARGGGSRG